MKVKLLTYEGLKTLIDELKAFNEQTTTDANATTDTGQRTA